jgi:RNA polymerase sigma-70 factor (ECF subfamily)
MPLDLRDIRLAQQLSTTEPLYFTDIIDRYFSDIYRICYVRLGNREESEDVVQEIFIRIYRSFNTFKPGRQIWPWIYTITINYLKTHYARLQRLDNLQERITQNYQQHQEDPAELMVQREMREEMWRAVQSLPPKLKNVVKLHYIDNMSILDISEKLGLSRENVKIRLHRARKNIKGLLEHTEKPLKLKK